MFLPRVVGSTIVALLAFLPYPGAAEMVMVGMLESRKGSTQGIILGCNHFPQIADEGFSQYILLSDVDCIFYPEDNCDGNKCDEDKVSVFIRYDGQQPKRDTYRHG